MALTVRLLPEELARIARDEFVRLDLPRQVFDDEHALVFDSVLVGRDRRDGSLRVFANVCRHQMIPLDARAPDPADGVMTDDKRYLLCHAHGAIYRPRDGLCVSGPCAGASLLRIEATQPSAAELSLNLP